MINIDPRQVVQPGYGFEREGFEKYCSGSGKINGVPRESGFDISVASEVWPPYVLPI